MPVAFYSAGEITQVLDALPWVRCASGNVFGNRQTFSATSIDLDYDNHGSQKKV